MNERHLANELADRLGLGSRHAAEVVVAAIDACHTLDDPESDWFGGELPALVACACDLTDEQARRAVAVVFDAESA